MSMGTVVPARRLMLERPLSFVGKTVAETERSIIFITLFSSLGATDDEGTAAFDVVGDPALPLIVTSSDVSSRSDPALFFLPIFGLDWRMIGEGREVAALSLVETEEEEGDSRLLSSFMSFFVATEPTLGDGPNTVLSWVRNGLLGGVFVTKGRLESPEGRGAS